MLFASHFWAFRSSLPHPTRPAPERTPPGAVCGRSVPSEEELEARDEATSGNKSWLRRRLHARAAIVREYLD